MSLDDVTNELNKNSGLKGLCGKNDFRDVVALKSAGEDTANMAYDVFMDSIIKHIADEDKLEKVLENPQVIKTPVVRNGKQSTLGYQPDVWKGWI